MAAIKKTKPPAKAAPPSKALAKAMLTPTMKKHEAAEAKGTGKLAGRAGAMRFKA